MKYDLCKKFPLEWAPVLFLTAKAIPPKRPLGCVPNRTTMNYEVDTFKRMTKKMFEKSGIEESVRQLVGYLEKKFGKNAVITFIKSLSKNGRYENTHVIINNGKKNVLYLHLFENPSKTVFKRQDTTLCVQPIVRIRTKDANTLNNSQIERFMADVTK